MTIYNFKLTGNVSKKFRQDLKKVERIREIVHDEIFLEAVDVVLREAHPKVLRTLEETALYNAKAAGLTEFQWLLKELSIGVDDKTTDKNDIEFDYLKYEREKQITDRLNKIRKQ